MGVGKTIFYLSLFIFLEIRLTFPAKSNYIFKFRYGALYGYQIRDLARILISLRNSIKGGIHYYARLTWASHSWKVYGFLWHVQGGLWKVYGGWGAAALPGPLNDPRGLRPLDSPKGAPRWFAPPVDSCSAPRATSEGFLLCRSSAGAELSFSGRCRRVAAP